MWTKKIIRKKQEKKVSIRIRHRYQWISGWGGEERSKNLNLLGVCPFQSLFFWIGLLTVLFTSCLTLHGKCTNLDPSDIVTLVEIDSVSKYGDASLWVKPKPFDSNDDDDDPRPEERPPKNCRPRSRSSDEDINSSENDRTKRILANLAFVIEMGLSTLSSSIKW